MRLLRYWWLARPDARRWLRAWWFPVIFLAILFLLIAYGASRGRGIGSFGG